MVIRFDLKIWNQIGTSVSFDIKNGNPFRNAGTLKTIVCQMAPLAKLPPGGFLLFMKYDVFRQNAEFF